jgi:hypothetical protein
MYDSAIGKSLLLPFKNWLSAGLLVVLSMNPAAGQQHSSAAGIEQRFAALRKSPLELYAFLLAMPKGGDLHNHVVGAVYAENLIGAAALQHLCVDPGTLSFQKPEGPAGTCKVEAALAEANNDLFNSLVNSLSMRAFVPGSESAHDHFFAAFNKFNADKAPEPASFVVEVVRRAAEQNESYLELMALNGNLASVLGDKVGFNGDFADTAGKLRAAGIADTVTDQKAKVDAIEQSRLKLLNCSENPQSEACKVTVRYVYQVLREFPNASVFAQTLCGFMLAAEDPRVVAINFVQPEDGINSMKNYHLDMQMIDYIRQLYPKVHITLHAGELALGLVPPEGLRFHIREAIELGHAERIGHGVDVMYESNALGLLDMMKKRNVDVEVNLSSNDEILGVKGENHPFPVYRKFGIPVTLSTDDEGVGRTHLTEEYQRAVLTYGLSYADVKQIVRNSLQYSFLSGEGYWSDSSYRHPAKACAGGVAGETCQAFLAANEKARLQVDLEKRFEVFEAAGRN